MGDRLTQLQDAVDQLAQQFVACIYFNSRHHDLDKLGTSDAIRELKPEEQRGDVEPIPPEEFKSGQLELARDLIYKEQQIEYLITTLPGIDNSEEDQEQYIKELEEELKVAEAQFQEASKEKDTILAKLDEIIQSIRRP
ncbi:uncharacterized protein E0L32_004828 [Thyridium curvatum]|uniref:Mediator of RNA polymerase II transcription subunit 21 n=1 Tax=Thyridium curvatum TaxID=1093900 RepID=A0A507BDZ0_9PEZI|nr:uncharacterized protein E0L32_004828 [Thyridium curvatum]TPX14998.1 hypothetical protein E0L32_004828 [Thyridium curvatum]